MKRGGWLAALWLMTVVVFICGDARAAGAQEIQLGLDRPVRRSAEHVVLLTETASVLPGKPVWVELRFRVDPGFHINSHQPRDETLIPSRLNVEQTGPVKLLHEEYPAGIAFRLEGAGETLDVYQGEFRIRVQLLAPAGESTLQAALRYQACDKAACFPPRTLPVHVALTAR